MHAPICKQACGRVESLSQEELAHRVADLLSCYRAAVVKMGIGAISVAAITETMAARIVAAITEILLLVSSTRYHVSNVMSNAPNQSDTYRVTPKHMGIRIQRRRMVQVLLGFKDSLKQSYSQKS